MMNRGGMREEDKSTAIKLVIGLLVSFVLLFGLKILIDINNAPKSEVIGGDLNVVENVDDEDKDDEDLSVIDDEDEDEDEDEDDEDSDIDEDDEIKPLVPEDEDEDFDEKRPDLSTVDMEDKDVIGRIDSVVDELGIKISYDEVRRKEGQTYVVGRGTDIEGNSGYVSVHYRNNGVVFASPAFQTMQEAEDYVLSNKN